MMGHDIVTEKKICSVTCHHMLPQAVEAIYEWEKVVFSF